MWHKIAIYHAERALPTGDEPSGRLDSSKAKRTAVGARNTELDQGISSGHTSGTSRKGRSFMRVPSLGEAQLTPPGVSGTEFSRQQQSDWNRRVWQEPGAWAIVLI